MKYLIHLFIFLSVVANAQTHKRLLITDVNIVDVTTGKISKSMSLLIEGDRIAAVRQSIRPAVNDSVINASGKFMIPGLWDMHTHVLGDYKKNFALLLANGITGIRNLHSTVKNPLHALAIIRQELKEGILMGPRLVANGQIIDGEPAFWPSTYIVRNADEARKAVDSLVRGGAEFIKVYNHLSREAYFAIADECKKRNIPFEGHVPYLITVAEAAHAGQKSFEHNNGLLEACSNMELELKQVKERSRGNDSLMTLSVKQLIVAHDTQKRTEMISLLAKGKVWQCPTLVVYIATLDSTEIFNPVLKRYSSEDTYKAALADYEYFKSHPWSQALEQQLVNMNMALIKDMSSQGVPLLAGTDVGNPGIMPGYSLHKELSHFVKAGLTTLETLQAATINPAIFFEKETELGTIAIGKFADLLILDANPLTNIENTNKIHAVIVNGKYLSRQRLDSLLAYAQTNKE
jgi:imidazolonepropionase-like amidohydrolase